MTDDRLADIKARYEAGEGWFELAGTACWADMDWMIAELERLRVVAGEATPRVWIVSIGYGGTEWDIDSVWSTEEAAQQRSQDPEVRTIYNYAVDVTGYDVDPDPVD